MYDACAAGALCASCPLRGSKVVPPGGSLDPDLVILGENPAYEDELRGKYFTGRNGVLLNDLLEGAGIERSRLWLTSTILCRPVLEDGKTDMKQYIADLRRANIQRKKRIKAGEAISLIPSPIDCCRPRLVKELQDFDAVAAFRDEPNGIVIVALGSFALEVLTGRSSITKYRGSPLEVKL